MSVLGQSRPNAGRFVKERLLKLDLVSVVAAIYISLKMVGPLWEGRDPLFKIAKIAIVVLPALASAGAVKRMRHGLSARQDREQPRLVVLVHFLD
jgi:hypothetical protein